MSKKRKARARKRREVKREERVKATPETLAKLKPWPMQELLRLGPENGGIDAEQFEAALQICDGYRAITFGLGYRPLELEREHITTATREMGVEEERLATIYLEWGFDIRERLGLQPWHIVERIESSQRFTHGLDVAILCAGLDRWSALRDEFDRARRAKRSRLSSDFAIDSAEKVC